MKNHFILYHTQGCHLCEQAFELCQQLGIDQQLTLIDIVDDESLTEQFGICIPVIANPKQQLLYWPFDLQQLHEFAKPWN